MYIYLDLESNSFLCALSCIERIWTKHLQPIRFEQNGTQKKGKLKVPCEHSSVSRKLDCVRVFSPPGLQKKCKISGGLELQGSSGGLWANYHKVGPYFEDDPC